MDAMGSLVSVQSSVTELATEESLSELRRSREILGGHILRHGLVSVLHGRSLEEGISDIQSVGGVDDFVALFGEAFSREHLGIGFCLLHDFFLGFDIVVDEDIKFASLTHGFQDFVLVCQLRIFQS